MTVKMIDHNVPNKLIFSQWNFPRHVIIEGELVSWNFLSALWHKHNIPDLWVWPIPSINMHSFGTRECNGNVYYSSHRYHEFCETNLVKIPMQFAIAHSPGIRSVILQYCMAKMSDGEKDSWQSPGTPDKTFHGRKNAAIKHRGYNRR